MKAFTIVKKVLFSVFMLMLFSNSITAQCNRPYIQIDGNRVLADNSQTQNGLTLPFWLKAGQTLAADQNVNSISAIEFLVTGGTLTFSQVLSVTSLQTVPPNTVWKVESIIKGLIYNNTSGLTISTGGTYSWKVPSCVTQACIELWGAGGGGGGSNSGSAGGGGGGGAYGYQCFTVTPGTTYTITLGIGGIGGDFNASGEPGTSSSVGTLISAGGGLYGIGASPGGTGGAGGTSTAAYNLPGGNGANRFGNVGGSGGGSPNGANGGVGTTSPGVTGGSPGGGGAGAGTTGVNQRGGNGGDGKVIISW